MLFFKNRGKNNTHKLIPDTTSQKHHGRNSLIFVSFLPSNTPREKIIINMWVQFNKKKKKSFSWLKKSLVGHLLAWLIKEYSENNEIKSVTCNRATWQIWWFSCYDLCGGDYWGRFNRLLMKRQPWRRYRPPQRPIVKRIVSDAIPREVLEPLQRWNLKKREKMLHNNQPDNKTT